MPQSIRILQAPQEPRVTMIIGDSESGQEITLPLNVETLDNLVSSLTLAKKDAGWGDPPA